MASKCKVLKDSSGKVISIGFTDFVAESGQTVEDYDGSDVEIIKQVKDRRKKKPKAIEDLISLDPDNLDADALKVVVKALQKKFL